MTAEDEGRASTARAGLRALSVSRATETWLAPTSAAPTWIGVGIIAAGFTVIAYGWSRVAGLLSVPLQMPYMISAGFTGLGLVCVGVGVVAVQAKRQETAARERHLAELTAILERLDQHVTGKTGTPSDRETS